MHGCHGWQRYIIFAEYPNLSLCFFGKVPFLDKIVAMILQKSRYPEAIAAGYLTKIHFLNNPNLCSKTANAQNEIYSITFYES
jgi:hypothetical protein